MNDNPEVSILINNQNYVDFFTDISIFMSMETICGGMRFTTTDFFPEKVKNWKIKLNDEYTLKVNKKIVSKGYIDEIEINQDDGENIISFTGRDKTSDLVDCHYVVENEPGTWEKLSILQIIKRLCDPFNITVNYDKLIAKEVLEKPDEKFTSDQATPVIDLIMKACNKTGILPMSIGDGNLTLTRATKINFMTDLIDTNMVKNRTIRYSDKERYSSYIAKGQSSGNDNLSRLFNFTSPSSTVIKDEHFGNRYRPYMLLVDDNATDDFCKKKAIFEKNSRAGNSREIDYVVQGWTGSLSDKLWRPNYLVAIDDPVIGKKDTLLITEVELSATADGGFETNLKLIDKNTYSLNEKAEIKTEFDKQ